MNETDLCVGNIWVTSPRLLIHPSFLIIRITDDVDGWNKSWAPLSKIFSGGAWLMMTLAIMGASISLVLVKGSAIGDGADVVLDLYNNNILYRS